MGLFVGALGDAVGGLMGGNSANLQGALGGLLGQLGGGTTGGQSAMIATVMTLVQQHGGVGALVEQFRAGGLGEVVNSWVGTGANAAISGTQLTQVLGDSTIGTMASQLGVDPSQASASLASMLPELINQLTPNGTVDAGSSDLLAKGLSMLQGLQGR